MLQVITLTEQEVTEAIIDYASKHGVKFEGMQAEVSVIAGRKENGTYATIDLKPKLGSKYEKTSNNSLTQEFKSEVNSEKIEEEFLDSIDGPDVEEESITNILKEDEPDDEEELFS